ncbi:FAD/NAD(P)-binding domain-containing protein [Agrocybe pediades]|nr:FAD/NAD(P)-binding domain-containing protein [Agrocybe pediades]
MEEGDTYDLHTRCTPCPKMPRQKLRVAIVGSGIGGLAMGVALSKLGLVDVIQIDVYESTSKLVQVGAGITIWPRAWEILQNMGLESSLTQRFPPDQRPPRRDELRTGFIIRKGDMKEGVPIIDVHIPGGSVSFHRADVQDALLEHVLPSVNTHLSHRLQRYRHIGDNEIELEFRNGRKCVCDLLIGADGINSAVRRTMLAERQKWTEEETYAKSRPLWTGTIVYRSLIDSEIVRGECPNHTALTKPIVYAGKDKHIVAYPISQGRLVYVIPFLSDPEKEGTYLDGPPVVEVSDDDFAPQFAAWENEVQVLIKNMVKPSRWAIQTVAPLDTYVSDSRNVLLLGDAAHAMPPHLGNGAGQAIEGAWILANLFAKASRMGNIDVPKITEIYDLVRQPFGNFAAAASNRQGHFYELNCPGFEDVKDGEALPQHKLDELASFIEDGWSWTWGSANDDLEKALNML